MSTYHVSVLLAETIDNLLIKAGEKYIDATLGGGGHTRAILEHGGEVLGIDTDQDAIDEVRKQLPSSQLHVVRGNFSEIEAIAKEHNFQSVDGIIFDLGVSSHQFDETERGFSFLRDADLDMRMDTRLSVTAADLVNGLTKRELTELFAKLGEERFAGRIAEAIVKKREKKQITRTVELADIVKYAVPRIPSDIHPATRVFQALRLAVNDELNSLKTALPQAVSLLKNEGKLAVITFHSLEDRIVKEQFLAFEERGLGTVMTKKPIVPSDEEIAQNKRSRSAKLRVFQKTV
jgi:16S rRNA (cytosine1402-N4)-methyltransferase